jgi:uncharacterized SAM-binding protein YcdF (DUF218 family)
VTTGKPTDVVVIFGAAVRPGGAPSGALMRRVAAGLQYATQAPDCRFILTGGLGEFPPTEAEVMARLLRERSIGAERLFEERRSTTTLESVVNCISMMSAWPDVANVVLCSDYYHLPRCRWLFRIRGVPTRAWPADSSTQTNHWLKWLWFHLREMPAIALDTLLSMPAMCRALGSRRGPT